MKIKNPLEYFTKTELILWIGSVLLITGSFCIFDGEGYLTLIASLIGVTSLIFSAKGHVLGPLLMIFFSILYGIISYSFSYYGEMATYMGMSGPMAVFALISWLRNPFKDGKAEVRVNRLEGIETAFMIMLTIVVTIIFYFILKVFNTANLLPSTLSVATSFAAVYLTFRRSAFFPLVYAANDIVLIVMWVMAAMEDFTYLSVIICFAVFLVNDIYGFINWQRMKKRQAQYG